MREYDLQEMKRAEMEDVNGGTSQVTNAANTNIMDSIINVFNDIKDYFAR